METTVEAGEEKQVPPVGRNDKRLGGCENVTFTERKNSWAQVSATAGAAVWAALAVLARIGILRLGEIDFAGSDVLTIPQMARTRGILNAFGFCLLGLLGWLVEGSPRNRSCS